MRGSAKELIWILAFLAGLAAIAVLLCLLLGKDSSYGENGRFHGERPEIELREEMSLPHGRLCAEITVECRNGRYVFRNAEACTEGSWVTVREYSGSGKLRSMTEFNRGEVLAVRRYEEEACGE